MGGRTWHTDASGTVTFGENVGGRDIDIDAPGFLLRQTQVDTDTFTLWPATAGEEEAIKAMVYQRAADGHLRLNRPYFGYFIVSTAFGDAPNGAAVTRSLQISATRVSELLAVAGGPFFTVSSGPQGDDQELTVDFIASTSSCGTPWGFCETGTSPWKVSLVPETAGRADVPLRVIAQILLRANPLPGLMNSDQPASDLSRLEQQTIRMLFKRPGIRNEWPDRDRP